MIFPLLYTHQFIITSYSRIGILSNLGLLTTFLFQVFLVPLSNRFEYKHLLFLSYAGIGFQSSSSPYKDRFSSLLSFISL